MKTFFTLSILLISLFIFNTDQNSMNVSDSSFNLYCPPALVFTEVLKSGNMNSVNSGETGIETGIDESWKESIFENLKKQEYQISYDEKTGAYQSPNRASNLRFIYHKDGFTAVQRDAKRKTQDTGRETLDARRETSDRWSVRFKVSNVKCQMSNVRCETLEAGCETLDVRRETIDVNSQLSDNSTNSTHSTYFTKSELTVAGNKAFIEDENIRIDYTNDEAGMRQDFIIKKKPEGEGRLRLQLSADTKLKMIVGADALVFKDNSGDEKMRYSALKCWDANGKELRAYFEKSSELGIKNYELGIKEKGIPNSEFQIPNSFAIVVNDEEAVYPVTIDPLSSSYSWSRVGPTTGSQFGFSVSTAGDVNGDGYSDVIAGAYSFESPETDEGIAQVFYGSATGLSTNAAWNVQGNQSNANFGWSVSTAGDVNGDGYSDVIVGARNYSNYFGAAFVYHGSASGLSTTPNWTKQGPSQGGDFGHCVSTAGDVDGDGYSDVIVSGIDLNSTGQVFLYKGSSSGLSTTASQTLSGSVNSQFGSSISTAGDVNGDGYSDIIVGAQNYNSGFFFASGNAYVYLGENTAAGINSIAIWFYPTSPPGSNFGSSVSTAGDVNGDGYSDVIIGSLNYSSGEITEGRAQVFYGNSSGVTATPVWTYESDSPGAKFGASVKTAGDVNGDGYADVIIGAPEYSNTQTAEGSAYVFFGSASGLNSNFDWSYETNAVNQFLGTSVCVAGDIDGDGFSDVIVGSPNAGLGFAYVFKGFAAGLASSANWSNENNQIGSQLGYSVSIAGDVNGDGYSDVIVGAPFYDNGQTDEGRAYVYHGSLSGLSVTPDWTKEINEDSAQFGFAVSTAGDINGDGYSDVIISANLFDGANYSDQGRVWVYNGSSSGLSNSASWNDNSLQDNAHFGSSVSTAGDVNGDGFSDIIVGADNYNSGESGEGKVFVYYGSLSGLTTNPVWTAEGDQTNAYFGNAVNSAGDVNGDRYSDIIIGAWNYSNGQNGEGAAFLYYGSSSGLPLSENVLLESDQAGARFGISVSGAGDVNGDAYSDIVIGSNFYDNAESNEGRAYIYNGSSSGISTTPAITLEINQGGAKFGQCVSNAGDVNGDGYSDVIVSAPDYDNGQSNEGRVYLYYGSPAGIPASSVWFYEPDQANTDFGFSISTAGDVNGDGYSDIITGSPLQNNGQTDEGLTLVFYGNLSTCKRANTRQFENGTSNVVCSGNNTGGNGTARLQIYANNPYGRSDGKIVYERKRDGNAFSGAVITNSTDFTNSGAYSDLTFNGKNISQDISGLNSGLEYKWRARVLYKLTNNPYQKYGPWRYYRNYIPLPSGDFKPKVNTSPSPSLTLNALIQGFYDQSSDTMVRDTVTVYVREYIFPYSKLDSAKFYLNTSGSATKTFTNPAILNGAMYYLQVKHRNSIETWNNGSVFINGTQTFDFIQSSSSAYGNNEIQVNTSPDKFAIYGGDEDQNGLVDLNDVINVYNASITFATGYIQQDMNGDNIADLNDVLITYNNSNAFVNAIVP